MERIPSKRERPVCYPPWKNYRLISGHLGCVRSIAVDPSNNWFCTRSADRTIKIWDLASGRLKLTLTGHIGQIRGLAISSKHTYMFSAGDDKEVKCWDLEQNKVWDIRSQRQIHALSGHENTVCSVITRPMDPQVLTGSHDTTIKLWDLRKGETVATLTYHKKSVRAIALHPKEECFASASSDNIKKFNLPRGEFLQNMLPQHKTIVNAMAINGDGVLATAGDNGTLWLWDWKTGRNFQQTQDTAQPGSLEAEAGVYALSYDVTGSRLITCGVKKTIKVWKENESLTLPTQQRRL